MIDTATGTMMYVCGAARMASTSAAVDTPSTQITWVSANAVSALADTQVIWVDGVSTAAEVDAILAAPHTYIIVPVAVSITGGSHSYAGQYINAKPDEESPDTFWWGQGQHQAGHPITEAIPYYIATYGG